MYNTLFLGDLFMVIWSNLEEDRNCPTGFVADSSLKSRFGIEILHISYSFSYCAIQIPSLQWIKNQVWNTCNQ